MANIILNTPIVEPIQPAFPYSDSSISICPIEFQYAPRPEQTNWKVGVTLSNPNTEVSINAIYNTEFKTDSSQVFFDNNKNIYYILLEQEDLYFNQKTQRYSGNLKLNVDNTKKLVKDQYYQVQLFIANYTNEGIDATSSLSQATLIRPVSGFSTEINLDPIETSNLTRVAGNVFPLDAYSKEYLKECYYTISKDTVVYATARSYDVSKFNFDIGASVILDPSSYDLALEFITINGLVITYQLPNYITIRDLTPIEENLWEEQNVDIKFTSDPKIGGVTLSVSCLIDSAEEGDKICIQRTSILEGYSNWKDMAYFVFEEDISSPSQFSFNWKDCFLTGNQTYRYRLYYKKASNISSYQVNYLSTAIFQYKETGLEHIYLSDSNQMLVVQYNPNVSGFKYVTQENTTNTLGGKYPIIRVNGDTYYRQFSLSGTLYFNQVSAQASLDSQGILVDKWMEDAENSGLYFSNETAQQQLWINSGNQELIQTQMREAAIAFLTNRTPKIYRSREEGLIICYLSGVSFTPNKQLSRLVWDFSATVTEVAEANDENLKRYGFNNIEHKGIYTYKLSIDKVENYCAFVQAEDYITNANALTLKAYKVGDEL